MVDCESGMDGVGKSYLLMVKCERWVERELWVRG